MWEKISAFWSDDSTSRSRNRCAQPVTVQCTGTSDACAAQQRDARAWMPRVRPPRDSATTQPPPPPPHPPPSEEGPPGEHPMPVCIYAVWMGQDRLFRSRTRVSETQTHEMQISVIPLPPPPPRLARPSNCPRPRQRATVWAFERRGTFRQNF